MAQLRACDSDAEKLPISLDRDAAAKDNKSEEPISSTKTVLADDDAGLSSSQDRASPRNSVHSSTARKQTIFTFVASVRPFYGIIHDIRARTPHYWSDWTDSYNYRVVPATLLIFFAK